MAVITRLDSESPLDPGLGILEDLGDGHYEFVSLAKFISQDTEVLAQMVRRSPTTRQIVTSSITEFSQGITKFSNALVDSGKYLLPKRSVRRCS